MNRFKAIPTCFEIYNSESDLVAKIEMVDAASASVTIEKRCFNSDSWRELANHVYSSLRLMELDGDE